MLYLAHRVDPHSVTREISLDAVAATTSPRRSQHLSPQLPHVAIGCCGLRPKGRKLNLFRSFAGSPLRPQFGGSVA
jgi:hypothetical protein